VAKVSIGGDSNGHHPLRLARAGELDDEKAVLKLSLADLDPACQAKASLELPRGDAAMEKVAGCSSFCLPRMESSPFSVLTSS
jgi:hypothetical protein